MHRDDAGSLKLTVLIYVGCFKGYCWDLKQSFLMFMKFKKTFLKKLLSTVALVCFILVVRVSVCWMNFISYIIAGNLTKTRFYIFIYVLWNINLLSSFTSLFSYVYSYFFSVFFFLKTLLNQNYSISTFSKAYESSS